MHKEALRNQYTKMKSISKSRTDIKVNMSRRSGRRAYTYAEKQALAEAPTNEEEEEEEQVQVDEEDADEEDEQEVTRCVCGRDELNSSQVIPVLLELLYKEYHIKIDQGLFIQCDKCSVWQHGYCVGLFTNDEVPDKYWCELCKSELHVLLYDHNEILRTLYKPVNEKRKKLTLDQLGVGQQTIPHGNSKLGRARNKRTGEKPIRKERRHYDYDEQLEKALRESVKESGGLPEEHEARIRKEIKEEQIKDEETRSPSPEPEPVAQVLNVENPPKKQKLEESDERSIADDTERSDKRVKPRGRARTKKKTPPVTTASDSPLITTENLVVQSLKPRYVSDRSSVYELRKRTGAILEWLGRSQIELEEEKVNKLELFSYKEPPVNDEESNKLLENYNENSSLMAVLTEKILSWEDKFGKYAP